MIDIRSLIQRRRRGSILIVTIWIVFVLAGLLLAFGWASRSEVIAAANHSAQLQAESAEKAGEVYAMALIDQFNSTPSAVLWLPESCFQGIRVGDCYVWIVRPNYGEPDLPSFGLVDESSKINLNAVAVNTLLLDPSPWIQLNTDLAYSIIDWRDTGGDSSYYEMLSNPYSSKVAPFDLVEELLQVRGMQMQTLYGQGLVPTSPIPPDEADSFGAGLTAGLPGSGSAPGGGSTPGGPGSAGGMGLSGNPFNDWSITHGLFDEFTVYSAEPASTTGGTTGTSGSTSVTIGLINVLTAPYDVLATLGLSDSDIQTIINLRPTLTSDDRASTSWFTQNISSGSGLSSYITVKAYQYSADIIAVHKSGRAFKRCRIVVDAQSSPPRILYRKDITEHGWPTQLPPEFLTMMRDGTFDPDQQVITTVVRNP